MHLHRDLPAGIESHLDVVEVVTTMLKVDFSTTRGLKLRRGDIHLVTSERGIRYHVDPNRDAGLSSFHDRVGMYVDGDQSPR